MFSESSLFLIAVVSPLVIMVVVIILVPLFHKNKNNTNVEKNTHSAKEAQTLVNSGSPNNGKNQSRKSNKSNDSPEVKSYHPGKSCFNCKYCDASNPQNGQIYCKWDQYYYFPETGLNCDRLTK